VALNVAPSKIDGLVSATPPIDRLSDNALGVQVR